MSARERCFACRLSLLPTILDLGQSPIADQTYGSAEEAKAARVWPLGMQRCAGCGAFQLGEIVPNSDLWAGYGYFTSASPALERYFADYADSVIDYWSRGARSNSTVVEIGCNDGTMLKHFHEAGFMTLGVEPSEPQAAAARSRGLDVIGRPFDGPLMAEEVRSRLGDGADIVIANNVLAHVADQIHFVKGVAALLKPGGFACVEVQNAVDLIDHGLIDLVYHQHRAFFTLSSLRRVLAAADLRIDTVTTTDSQGGSLRVIASKHDVGRAIIAPSLRLSGVNGLELQRRADRMRADLREALRAAPKPIVMVGAPAKATTLLAWTGIGAMVDCALDLTPSKIGRWLPDPHNPVEIVEETPERLATAGTLVVASHNYLPGIMAKISTGATRPRIVVPLPSVISF